VFERGCSPSILGGAACAGGIQSMVGSWGSFNPPGAYLHQWGRGILTQRPPGLLLCNGTVQKVEIGTGLRISQLRHHLKKSSPLRLARWCGKGQLLAPGRTASEFRQNLAWCQQPALAAPQTRPKRADFSNAGKVEKSKHKPVPGFLFRN